MAETLTKETAGAMMDTGFHCSQCVFLYAARKLGFDEAEALKLSAGLGGGCFHGDSCGAVTGAVLALGLRYGYDSAADAEEKDPVLKEKVKELERRFTKKHASLLCRDLLGGFDKADPNAKAPDGVDVYQNCPEYCADAFAIVDGLIDNA